MAKSEKQWYKWTIFIKETFQKQGGFIGNIEASNLSHKYMEFVMSIGIFSPRGSSSRCFYLSGNNVVQKKSPLFK